MAIQLPGGGGFSPGLTAGSKPPGGLPLPPSLLNASVLGRAIDQSISYGGSSGTPMSGLSSLPAQQDADMLPAMLMLLGMEAAGIPEELLTGALNGEEAVQNAGNGMRSEKDTSIRPTEENLTGRPPGDNRSAEQIIDENPVLKNLGNQKDIKRDQLKERFGDWTDANKDPKSRADAAWNMAAVLNNVKSLNGRDGSERTEVSANDKIEGITKDGDARHGTEAGVLKDIAEQGLKMLPDNGQLPDTKDTHVRIDGTNKDNFQWGMGEFGKILSNIPILKSVAAPFFNNIGEARDLGEVFTGGLKGLAEGGMSAARGPIGWGITAATDTARIVAENVGKDKKEPPPFS